MHSLAFESIEKGLFLMSKERQINAAYSVCSARRVCMKGNKTLGKAKTNMDCVRLSEGHHGVCGSFFRVSINLSRGMAARVMG